MKVYVASSWRNNWQPSVVKVVRRNGHEAYDFRNPEDGDCGFHWSEIDEAWQSWDLYQYRDGLRHSIAERGFSLDFAAMQWADACVQVAPCGRSAHLEAGWFVGQGKPTALYILDEQEPELMYKMFDRMCMGVPDLEAWLAEVAAR